jgi:hypothetical protein
MVSSFFKKAICFLIVSHKHSIVIKKLCSDTSVVRCDRCEELFIHYNQSGIYQKHSKDVERLHSEYGGIESFINTVLRGSS